MSTLWNPMNVALMIVGTLLVFRQIRILLAAEQGRKLDLIKKRYKPNQTYHLSVLIPYLSSRDFPELMSLLAAIADQDYPAARVSVQIVTSEHTNSDLLLEPLNPNVRLWRYPGTGSNTHEAMAWLIDRCLALGGVGMFVFLKPTDIIKADFLQNVAARGSDHYVIQGYVANKSLPSSFLAKVTSLSRRLVNRIGNAGRHHLGLSCRLLDSGWAIRQELLEMVPYHQGWDMDNFEYTLRLNLSRYQVNWAPNVVVYAQEEDNTAQVATEAVAAFFNRIALLVQYGPRLLIQALFKFQWAQIDNFLTLLKPPTFVLGAALVLMAFLSQSIPQLGQPQTWILFAGAMIILQGLSLRVARCKWSDATTMFGLTPVVYLSSLIMLPVALSQYVSSLLNRRAAIQADQTGSYKKTTSTRFNEDLEPVSLPFSELYDSMNAQIASTPSYAPAAPTNFWDEELPLRSDFQPSDYPAPPPPAETYYHSIPETMQATHPQAFASQRQLDIVDYAPDATGQQSVILAKEHVTYVPLTNGRMQVDCQLTTYTSAADAQGHVQYQMTLAYKGLAFSTAAYRILDQAYYELLTKLKSKGLTMINCGSCGYFYNPMDNAPGTIRNAGVCLFGKMSTPVDWQADAVTVLSRACDYHTSVDQREQIVQEWKQSLKQLAGFPR